MKIDKKNLVLFNLMKRQYKSIINYKNLYSISRIKLWKIFKNENNQDKMIYLRNITSEWIDNFRGSDENLFTKLKKILRKTKIQLSDIERDRLLILEERSFTEIRQIKAIDVQYLLKKGETVGAKYINSNLYENKFKAKNNF